MQRRLCSILGVAFLLTHAFAAAGQGIQTSEMRGVVTDPSGAVVPGATVALTSPSLQGVRTTNTDGAGSYIVRGLPPGTYVATITLSGFAVVERTVQVPLGASVELDVSLSAAPLSEQVTVVGQGDSLVRQTQVGTNLEKETVDLLPIGRTPYGIAATMPGLTTNTANAGQLTISGAFGYDNVFLVDGTDINDNLFGTTDPLFIEDAILETQVLTGGISAEYGRFSGGVVNVVSRSGGNVFSGSFREGWTNPTWAGRTPFDEENDAPRTDTLNKTHEGTFGGPILRDRLWFFAAGRTRGIEEDETFPQTGLPYVFSSENSRGQLRLTTTFRSQHTVSGQYLRSHTTGATPAFGFTIDPAALMRPEYPNSQFVVTYRGAVRPSLFAEVQYSTKRSGFRDAGGTNPDIFESPIISQNPLAAYNAPYFDATDPEDRDNRQVTGSLSYFLSRWGRHDVKGGVEAFTSTNRGGNSQTATGYVFYTSYRTDASGRPALDADGRLSPVFTPGQSVVQRWLPVRGATIDISTTSFYVQDRWSVNDHWSAVAGTRGEFVRSHATGGIVGVDTSTIVPRLGVTFDPAGNGLLVFRATYGHYAGKYGEAQFSRNTNVGNPDVLAGVYIGPSGSGRRFGPGFDVSNYVFVDGSFPAANIVFDEDLSSPVSKEFTLQAGRPVGRRAFVNAAYVSRRMTNFVEDFVTLDTGSTFVSQGGVSDVFSNIVYRNSDLPRRVYRGLELFGRYSPADRWMWNAAWTVQLKNEGNFEGEATNQPGLSSVIGEYPEAFNEQRHYPIGRLAGFQRHALRTWSVYGLNFGRFGGLDVAAFFSVDSGLTYSLRAGGQPLSALQRAAVSGYISQPTSQTLYFGSRGSEDFESYSALDMALTYRFPTFKGVRPWLKLEMFNALDNDKLVTWNTTVTSDPTSALDPLGLPTGYIKGPLFGRAQGNGNYLPPRTFQMAFGVRW